MDAWGLSVCPVALPIPTQLVDLTTMEYNNEKQLLRFTVRVEHLRELPRIRLEALEHDLLEVHGVCWLLPHTQRKEPLCCAVVWRQAMCDRKSDVGFMRTGLDIAPWPSKGANPSNGRQNPHCSGGCISIAVQ